MNALATADVLQPNSFPDLAGATMPRHEYVKHAAHVQTGAQRNHDLAVADSVYADEWYTLADPEIYPDAEASDRGLPSMVGSLVVWQIDVNSGGAPGGVDGRRVVVAAHEVPHRRNLWQRLGWQAIGEPMVKLSLREPEAENN